MNVFTVAAVAVITACLALTIRRSHPELTLLITLLAGILILGMVLGDVIPLLGTVRSLFARSGLPSEYMQIVLKALGICLLTQLASDACRDAGEQGLANKVDLVGKATLLTMAIPLFERVGGMAVALMERS